jgi:hypothetical protein
MSRRRVKHQASCLPTLDVSQHLAAPTQDVELELTILDNRGLKVSINGDTLEQLISGQELLEQEQMLNDWCIVGAQPLMEQPRTVFVER